MGNLKFSICIPAYNGASTIGETLKSILSQSYQDFEIIISDDCSKDNTLQIARSFKDERIRIFKNSKNLGYGKNLSILLKLVNGDILYFMGQDDILLKDALLKTYHAFLLSDDIGAVTRPYYWFDENVKKPVRAVMPYSEKCDSVISIYDNEKAIQKVFESVGQLSSLAYRVKYIDCDFHEETFTSHIYPFACIMKKHSVVFLKDYPVAVRIASSQTRFKSSIYDISPTESWVKLFNTVFNEDKYKTAREVGIEQITKHFAGLVQLKLYSSFKNLIREISLLMKYRPKNIFDFRFWFFNLATTLLPKRVLRLLVDEYKVKILSRQLTNIPIQIKV